MFCEYLSQSGNVRAACARAGISAPTAYKARRRDTLFARAWDEALALARHHAEAVLAERALEGVEEAVFYHGEEVARRRRYDSRLLLAHLARLDRLCEERAAAAGARADEEGEEGKEEPADFDRLLGELAGMLDPGESSYTRAQFVEDAAADAEREARYAQYEAEEAGEDGWDGVGPDPVLLAIEAARAEAGAEWDACREGLCARVDGVIHEAGRAAHPAVTSLACGSASLAPLPPAGGVGGGHPASRAFPPEPCKPV